MWAKSNLSSAPFIPGHLPEWHFTHSGSSDVDVILFGDFVKQILCAHRWPKARFRIWTLSTASKRACTEFLQIKSQAVGVIPRYELFPTKRAAKPWPLKNEKWTLVYGGRISRSKNFLFLLKVTSLLQTQYGEKVKLVCAGGFDQINNIEVDCEWPLSPFETEVMGTVKSLTWTSPPEFIGLKNQDQWTRSVRHSNPVFVSLSRFYMEDFGVAAAQAQQMGWPCLLSNWGGHQDVRGRNVRKIKPEFLNAGREIEVAEMISSRRFEPFVEEKSLNQSLANYPANNPTRFIDTKELTKLQNQLTKVYSRRILDFRENQFVEFIRSRQGRDFFGRYYEIFGHPPAQYDQHD
jgi:hypothetical protein